MKFKKSSFSLAVGFLAAFLLWTAALRLVDVQPIGPMGSAVGFAAMNRFVHDLTGVHMPLYTLTDRLSLIPLGFILGFASLGLLQWIRRKQLRLVDSSILVLGGFYMTVMAVYLFFESVAINYRPILINGVLEASYPSSTTVLVLCVIPTAILQFQTRIKNPSIRRWIIGTLTAFMIFMVIGRLLSGVHWLSDIIGGSLLSTGLVLMYDSLAGLEPK